MLELRTLVTSLAEADGTFAVESFRQRLQRLDPGKTDADVAEYISRGMGGSRAFKKGMGTREHAEARPARPALEPRRSARLPRGGLPAAALTAVLCDARVSSRLTTLAWVAACRDGSADHARRKATQGERVAGGGEPVCAACHEGSARRAQVR